MIQTICAQECGKLCLDNGLSNAWKIDVVWIIQYYAKNTELSGKYMHTSLGAKSFKYTMGKTRRLSPP